MIIQTILAFFGYVKIPTATILLCRDIKNRIDKNMTDNEIRIVKHGLETLELFLRSGRPL